MGCGCFISKGLEHFKGLVFNDSAINVPVKKAPRLCHCCKHCLLPRSAHVLESWALAWLQIIQNSGSQMLLFSVKTLSVLDCHWQNSRGKNNERERESSKYKRAHVRSLTGSVPSKIAKGLQRVSAPCTRACKNQTHVTWLTASPLGHKFILKINLP